MQLSRDVVVASIQVDLDDNVLARFQTDLLNRVHAAAPRAVILDVSGIDTLDSAEFASLRQIIAAVTIMGTQSILVGLQPGVVSALIEVNADVEGLQTAVDLDAAFELLDHVPDSDVAADADTDPDTDTEAAPEAGSEPADAIDGEAAARVEDEP